MTRMIAAMIIAVSIATVAAAQGPPGQEKKEAPEHSSISVKVAGLTCTASLGSGAFSAITYAFGATQNASITSASGGSGAGKATVMPLNLTKLFDECSPALFRGPRYRESLRNCGPYTGGWQRPRDPYNQSAGCPDQFVSDRRISSERLSTRIHPDRFSEDLYFGAERRKQALLRSHHERDVLIRFILSI